MRKVINQRCPNRCLATCSSTVVTLTQVVPLVLYTVQFFLSHVWATQSVSLPLSFAHVTCSLPIWSVHFKRYTSIILFSIVQFSNQQQQNTKKFCWTRPRSGQHSYFVFMLQKCLYFITAMNRVETGWLCSKHAKLSRHLAGFNSRQLIFLKLLIA
jgi:hypothetical protein